MLSLICYHLRAHVETKKTRRLVIIWMVSILLSFCDTFIWSQSQLTMGETWGTYCMKVKCVYMYRIVFVFLELILVIPTPSLGNTAVDGIICDLISSYFASHSYCELKGWISCTDIQNGVILSKMCKNSKIVPLTVIWQDFHESIYQITVLINWDFDSFTICNL